AHVIKARLAELQASRRAVVRRVGQQTAQILAEVEENTIAKTRRALFGEDFAPYYELCKNRLIFLDGGKDDVLFLEHYVLLGNYAKDPVRFEAMDALFQEFLREAGITIADDPAHKEAVETHSALLESVRAIRNEITNLEEQREATQKRLDRGESFFNKLLSSDDPADLKASLHDIDLRLKHQELKLEEMDPQVEEARQKLDFFRKGKASRLGEYLDEPENAQRLFDPNAGPEESAPLRAQLLTRLLDRLEQHEMLFHVLASYEVRPIVDEYCPPLHLQQLRRALVSKDELKQVERVIKQVPAKKLSLRTIEELSRRIQRYSREEVKGIVLRFAGDFLRLHRDLRDAEHLTTGMERINLVTTEKARELSGMNNRLYECVLPEEARPEQDNVISHVIIKADVRGSTHVGLDDHVGNYVILLWTGFFGKNALIEAIIHARQLARLLRRDQIDAFHTSGQVLGVAKIPVQPQEITGKTQNDPLHFLARIPLDSPGKLLNGAERQLLRGNLLDHSFDLFQLIFGNQRPAKLLKMQRRTVFVNDGTHFIAGQDMKEHLVLLEAVKKTSQ